MGNNQISASQIKNVEHSPLYWLFTKRNFGENNAITMMTEEKSPKNEKVTSKGRPEGHLRNISNLSLMQAADSKLGLFNI